MTDTARAPSSSPPSTSLEALTHLVRDDLRAVNSTIIASIKSDIPLIEQLASHLIMAGGKRMRPSLTIATAKLLNYTGDRHIRLATCVEFIHSATLLHDDVVDASELRRGEATANAVWGNEASVLVGDFLLSRAFQMMVDDGSLDVLRVLADASATIAAGEVKQLTLKHRVDIAESDYFDVIKAKTATLFAAACELSAIAAQRPDMRAPMRDFGMALGMCFQLVDDALDYSGDSDSLGKAIGDDWREGKATYPILQAYQHASAEDKAWLEQLFAEPDDTMAASMLARTQRLLASTKAIDATYARAMAEAEIARRVLTNFAPSPARDALEQTVHFCIHRTV